MARAQNIAKTFDTGNMQDAGWEGFLDMTAEAPGARAIEIADMGREFAEKADYEKFMNEPVGIIVESGGDRDPTLVPVGVNGDQKWLPRGVPVMIKRYHLERLARATETSFSTREVRNPDADEGHRVENKNRASFHITVRRDDNPRGQAWLSRMRREGC